MLRVRLPCGVGSDLGLEAAASHLARPCRPRLEEDPAPEGLGSSLGPGPSASLATGLAAGLRVLQAGPRDPPQALPPPLRRDAQSVYGKQGPWGTSCIRPLPAGAQGFGLMGCSGGPTGGRGHGEAPVASSSPRPASAGKVRGTELWEGLQLGAPGSTESPVPPEARRP